MLSILSASQAAKGFFPKEDTTQNAAYWDHKAATILISRGWTVVARNGTGRPLYRQTKENVND